MQRTGLVFSKLLWSILLGIASTVGVSFVLLHALMIDDGPPSLQREMQQHLRPKRFDDGRLVEEESSWPLPEIITSSTSACLYIMDDNHFLIEWLAYHYHVINLRNVIITYDPNSLTTPHHVLQRWKDRMSIKVWRDEKFLPADFEQKIQKRIRHGKDPALQYHRQRQADFNLECLREHKRRGRGWTLMVDVDEYMTFNPTIRNYEVDSNKNLDWNFPPIEEPGSMVELLDNIMIPSPEFDELATPCLPVFRRQFSAVESPDSDINTLSPQGFDGSNFQTMRWRRYGYDVIDYVTQLGTTCPSYRHVPNKVIIDLDRLRLQDLSNPDNTGNPHTPLAMCPENVYVKEKKTPLLVNHYMGTKEQWLYRQNDKRGQGYRLARYDDFNARIGIHSTDQVRPWLRGFVATMGEAEALRLLENVGVLEPLPGMKAKAAEDDGEGEVYPKYHIGDVVQANYKADGEYTWAEIAGVFAHDYYNVMYYDCTEEFATHAKLLRLTGHASDTHEYKVDMEKLAMKTAEKHREHDHEAVDR